MGKREDYNAKQLSSGALTPEMLTAMVKFWQLGHQLPADGMAGPKTQASLTAVLQSAAPAEITGHGQYTDLHIDAEGWLQGSGTVVVPSVRHYPLTTHNKQPLGIVWHYTAVAPGVPLWDRIKTYVRGKDRAASWHVLIEADGTMYQSVSFEQGSWHCVPGLFDGHRTNRCMVGIELASKDGLNAPAAQVAAAESLWRLLHETYQMKDAWSRLEHSKLDPARRDDPGPEWSARIQAWKL